MSWPHIVASHYGMMCVAGGAGPAPPLPRGLMKEREFGFGGGGEARLFDDNPMPPPVAVPPHSPPSLLIERVVRGDKWHPQYVSHVASSAVLIPAIRYSINYLEGSHNPDMMSEVVPRFEPFEHCCMAILFVGGRGKMMPHPTIPFSLLVEI